MVKACKQQLRGSSHWLNALGIALLLIGSTSEEDLQQGRICTCGQGHSMACLGGTEALARLQPCELLDHCRAP